MNIFFSFQHATESLYTVREGKGWEGKKLANDLTHLKGFIPYKYAELCGPADNTWKRCSIKYHKPESTE